MTRERETFAATPTESASGLFRQTGVPRPMGLLSDDDVGKNVFDDEGNLLGKILGLEEYGATVEPAADANPETLDPYEWEAATENRLADGPGD